MIFKFEHVIQIQI